MNNNYKSILDLIGDIYESSINPAHWARVLEQLAVITRSESAVLVLHDNECRKLNVSHAYGVPKPILAMLNSPLGSIDPGLKVMRTHPAGKAVNMYRLDDRELVPRIVHAIVSRLTDLFYFGGVNCFNDPSWHAGIGLHRTRQEGEYEPEVLELLEDLVPHFQRALRIQREFHRLQLQEKALRTELDRNIIGLILLNEEGQVHYINPMAKRLLDRHGAIDLFNNVLHACNKNEDTQLQQTIRTAATALPNTINQSHALGLTHPDHPMPLAVLVTPATYLDLAGETSSSCSLVAVYLTDPDDQCPIAYDVLMQVYGLSKREAMVAVAIANGREVNEIADMHGVSVQTVRTQIKSIFGKTGVSRQADLIRLLLSVPVMFET